MCCAQGRISLFKAGNNTKRRQTARKVAKERRIFLMCSVFSKAIKKTKPASKMEAYNWLAEGYTGKRMELGDVASANPLPLSDERCSHRYTIEIRYPWTS